MGWFTNLVTGIPGLVWAKDTKIKYSYDPGNSANEFVRSFWWTF